MKLAECTEAEALTRVNLDSVRTYACVSVAGSDGVLLRMGLATKTSVGWLDLTPAGRDTLRELAKQARVACVDFRGEGPDPWMVFIRLGNPPQRQHFFATRQEADAKQSEIMDICGCPGCYTLRAAQEKDRQEDAIAHKTGEVIG